MGERDNHIATRTSPRPRRILLTHGHGEEEVDDGVDEEVQPREEETAGGSHGGGGGGPWGRGGGPRGGSGPRGQRLLGPPSSLWMVLQWCWSSPPRRRFGRRKIRVPW